MADSRQKIRIGGVPFSVGARLVAGLDEHPDVELSLEPPSRLAGRLRRHELDVALVSSIEAFRHPGYIALPNPGIACDGKVRSVRLFLRTEPSAVRSLAVDRSSATSVALARVILLRRYQARIERTFEIEPTLAPDDIDADAVLLIGDAGLRAAEGERRTLDLGEEWQAWKGLPFVFALWLLRPSGDVVAGGRDSPDDARVRRVVAELRAAWARGEVAGIDDGTDGSIRYELGALDLKALRVFRDEALALGLCEPGIEPRWFGQRSGGRPEEGRTRS
jgi:chorismate dehydratase